MKELAITATHCISSVGHDAPMTAAAVRAGISRFRESEEYVDRAGNAVTVAPLRGMVAGGDTVEYMVESARLCLHDLLNGYFREDLPLPLHCHLLLGVAAEQRPGPRYEESCSGPLAGILQQRLAVRSLRTFSFGNAAMHNAVAQAGMLLESDPEAVCIVGCLDSLLRPSTLNWFEQDGRLKSVSYGRQHGLIAGEAVGFMVMEDPARVQHAQRPVLARITGLGLAAEPVPRVANGASRGSGLADACRGALEGMSGGEILSVFGDLNGENSRAMEWCIAHRRCFSGNTPYGQFRTPANCYGDVGAASGGLMTILAVQGFLRGWLQSPALIFCSDDHGPCGALVLEP